MNTPDFPQRLKKLREASGLSQEKFAKTLFLSRGLYNGLETGREQPSDWVVQQVNMLEKLGVGVLAIPHHGAPAMVREDQAPYGTPAQVRAQLRALLDHTIALAGDDVLKLGWIRVQLAEHLTPPESWGKGGARSRSVLSPVHTKVEHRVLEEQREREAEHRARTQSLSSAKAQGER